MQPRLNDFMYNHHACSLKSTGAFKRWGPVAGHGVMTTHMKEWVLVFGNGLVYQEQTSSSRNRWGKELAWSLLTLLLPLLLCELSYHSPSVHISPCNALHRGTPTRSCGWHLAYELPNCGPNKPLTFSTAPGLTNLVTAPQRTVQIQL